MARYHSAWTTVVALVGVVGLFVAVQRLGAVAAATVCVLAATLVGALAAAVERDDGRKMWHTAVRPGAVGGAVALASMGMVFLLGNVGLLVLLAGTVSSPPVLRWLRHRSIGDRHLPGPGSRARAHSCDPDSAPAVVTALARVDAADLPESMSDAALCLAWRKSYVALQRSDSVTAHLLVVQQRQRYLDELERRNPSGLSGWLASGPRAAGDPSRYIVQRADPGHPPAA